MYKKKDVIVILKMTILFLSQQIIINIINVFLNKKLKLNECLSKISNFNPKQILFFQSQNQFIKGFKK